MCRNWRSLPSAAVDPKPSRSSTNATPTSRSRSSEGMAVASVFSRSSNNYITSEASAASSSASSHKSLASLRDLLPETPTIYPFHEISAATNHFLSRRLDHGSSSAWRCSLRGRDVVVVQSAFVSGDADALPSRLSAVCRSHHASLARLLGASLAGEHLYLVYEYVAGASLADCLRNHKNPSFTPLSTWTSRLQVAADLAQGLEYIHHHSSGYRRCRGTVHNRIKSSSIIVTEPNLRAKICHFGASELLGEVPDDDDFEGHARIEKPFRRSGSRSRRIEGTRGYMAPEVLAGAVISRASDVYAFGVVLLELLSGEESLKFGLNKETRELERASVIETAREAFGSIEDEVGSAAQERRGGVRRWVDQRLRDSFPVEVAERLVQVALRCVAPDPVARPNMQWVAGKVSKALVESKKWEENVCFPIGISVSVAPR